VQHRAVTLLRTLVTVPLVGAAVDFMLGLSHLGSRLAVN